MVTFGKMGHVSLQSNNGLFPLFSNRTHNSNMIYLVVEKVRNIQYGDASDCMLKLVELGNFHKPNGEVFELASNRGGRLQILH